jgi:hypothetical protein
MACLDGHSCKLKSLRIMIGLNASTLYLGLQQNEIGLVHFWKKFATLGWDKVNFGYHLDYIYPRRHGIRPKQLNFMKHPQTTLVVFLPLTSH